MQGKLRPVKDAAGTQDLSAYDAAVASQFYPIFPLEVTWILVGSGLAAEINRYVQWALDILPLVVFKIALSEHDSRDSLSTDFCTIASFKAAVT